MVVIDDLGRSVRRLPSTLQAIAVMPPVGQSQGFRYLLFFSEPGTKRDVRTSINKMSLKHWSLAAPVGFMFLLASCGNDVSSDDPTSAEDTPAETSATAPPPEAGSTMTLSPLDPSPGNEFSAFFAEDNVRSLGFLVHLWTGSEWGQPVYLLISDREFGESKWFPADNDIAINSISVEGVGPDGLRLPESMEPGYWRICTGGAARDRACAQFSTAGDN